MNVDNKPIYSNHQPSIDMRNNKTVKTNSPICVGDSSRVATPFSSGSSITPENQFKEKFGQLAANSQQFHTKMQATYGNNYSFDKAETIRQQSLSGDYSWLPKAEYTSSAQLRGANGAYRSDNGCIYLNEQLNNNPALANKTFTHEVGHRLDDIFGAKGGSEKSTDTLGDEGLLFQKMLDNEIDVNDKKSIQNIHNINDKGTMIDNQGKQVEVENFLGKIFSGIKKAVGAVGDGIKKAVNTVVSIPKKVGGFVKGAVEGTAKAVWGAVKSLPKLVAQLNPVNLWNNKNKLFHMITHPQDVLKAMATDYIDIAKGVVSGDIEKMGESVAKLGVEVGTDVLTGGSSKALKISQKVTNTIDKVNDVKDVVDTISSLDSNTLVDDLSARGFSIAEKKVSQKTNILAEKLQRYPDDINSMASERLEKYAKTILK